MSEKQDDEIKKEKIDVSSEDAENDIASNETEQGIENFNELLGEKGSNDKVDDEKETVSESRTEEISASQLKQYEKLGEVKEKISKILQASNIEIVDENIGDEYDLDDESEEKKQQQQDYDSLKALFGDADKNKKNELTLTIDEFDYTYVGQYVDEYDLMHVKNIKHIKLHRKHSKHFKKIIIAASVILVAGIAGLISFLLLRTKPVTLQSVALNQTSNIYYVNQKFDYTGLYFIAKYSDGSTRRIPLSDSNLLKDEIIGHVDRTNNEIKFLGGVGGSGDSVDLPFEYSGFRVSYNVQVKQKQLNNKLKVFYSDGLFDLREGEYITADKLLVFADYGEFGVEALPLSNLIRIKVNGTELVFSSLNNGYMLSSDINTASIIEITFETASISFSYERGSGIIVNK